METHPVKYDQHKNRADAWRHNWEVMKPFVHFAFKAITIIGGALVSIIKLLPMLVEHKHHEPEKNKGVIKI
jgi:hypothetical protein